jgi:hypothetical protein
LTVQGDFHKIIDVGKTELCFLIVSMGMSDYMAPAAFATKCLEQGSGSLRLAQDRQVKIDLPPEN